MKLSKIIAAVACFSIIIVSCVGCTNNSDDVVGEWTSIQASTGGPDKLEAIDGRFGFTASDDKQAKLTLRGETFYDGTWFKSDELSNTEEDPFEVQRYGVTLDGKLYMGQIFEHDGSWTLVLSGVDTAVEDIVFVFSKR